MKFRYLTPSFLVLAPLFAVADTAMPPDCLAMLTKSQRAIYDAVLLDYDPGRGLEPQVRTVTMALVTAGKIPMRAAPQDAQQAAECLGKTAVSGGD
jgi:hypothetical protein